MVAQSLGELPAGDQVVVGPLQLRLELADARGCSLVRQFDEAPVAKRRAEPLVGKTDQPRAALVAGELQEGSELSRHVAQSNDAEPAAVQELEVRPRGRELPPQ